MAHYSFEETIQFFSEKLGSFPPKEDLKQEKVELIIDSIPVVLSAGKKPGCISMVTTLGLFLQPIQEDRLKELAQSNFLGINTGGCKLGFDETKVALNLEANTTCGSSPQENWEWLHRLLSVAREWNKVLGFWDEFVPLGGSTK